MADPTYHFITIVTFGRSGSTALQSALNAHPQTLIRGENYNALTGLWNYYTSIVDSASRHHAGQPDHPWFGTARLKPNTVRAELHDSVVNTLLRPRRDTQWLGFKEVRYESAYFTDPVFMASYLLFLQELLPGLSFLFNTRSAEQAARSGWWIEHPDAQSTLERTENTMRSTASLLSALLGENRVQLIDYDQWNSDSSLLTQALERLRFPVEPSLIDSALSTVLAHGQHTGNGSRAGKQK